MKKRIKLLDKIKQKLRYRAKITNCEWVKTPNYWQSDCVKNSRQLIERKMFEFFKYCPYCGKLIKELRDESL